MGTGDGLLPISFYYALIKPLINVSVIPFWKYVHKHKTQKIYHMNKHLSGFVNAANNVEM